MDMLVMAAHLNGNGPRLQQAGQSMLSLGLALLAIGLMVAVLEFASAGGSRSGLSGWTAAAPVLSGEL